MSSMLFHLSRCRSQEQNMERPHQRSCHHIKKIEISFSLPDGNASCLSIGLLNLNGLPKGLAGIMFANFSAIIIFSGV